MNLNRSLSLDIQTLHLKGNLVFDTLSTNVYIFVDSPMKVSYIKCKVLHVWM